MERSYVNFFTKRNKKTAHVFWLIALGLIILSYGFGQAVLGHGVFVRLFDMSNFVGLIFLFSDLILAIIALLFVLYHLGENIF